jgi:hypothetical protein
MDQAVRQIQPRGGFCMELDIPLWVKVFALFVAVAAVFFLAAWDIIFEWISDTIKGFWVSKKRKL